MGPRLRLSETQACSSATLSATPSNTRRGKARSACGSHLAYDGLIEIAVADHGPDIPEGERARVADRFDRGYSSAGTSGIGLGPVSSKPWRACRRLVWP